MEPSVFSGFILAIVLGGIIGIEREMPWAGTRPGGAVGFGGIRTYASIAFFGAICVWLDHAMQTQFWVFTGAIISALLLIVSYTYSSFKRDYMGTTSEYAALITYFIGVITMMGEYVVSVILTITLLILLSAKQYFSELKGRFSRQELGDTLKFAAISLVILPLLPDTSYSILDIINWFYEGGLNWSHPVLTAKFFNPHSIWLFVVIMAGVEYAGFLLSKIMGSKGGIVASGAVGGMISSTAVTVAMTHKSKVHPEHRNSFVVATLIASSIMFLRVIAISAVVFPRILATISLPALVMFLGLVGMMLYFYLQARKEKHTETIENPKKEYESPFALGPALQFAGLIILIKFVSKLGIVYKDLIPQEISSYAVAVISGLADVDAITLTAAGNAKSGDLPLIVAASTILIAVISNNIVKASIAYRFGERIFGKKVALGFGVSVIMGIAIIFAMNFSGKTIHLIQALFQ